MKLSNNDKKIVNKYLNFLSDILMIDSFDVVYVDKRTRALANIDDKKAKFILNIAPNDHANKPSLFFALAHEMRHFCQWKSMLDKDYGYGWFDVFDIKTIKKETEDAKDLDLKFHMNIVDYNNRFTEIDANAFAYVIMCFVFGIEIKIDFQEMDETAFKNQTKLLSIDITYEEIEESLKASGFDNRYVKEWLIS